MTPTLTIKPSIEEVLKRIQAVIDNPAARKRVLERAVKILAGTSFAGKYPPETDRNSPPGHRGDGVWYQRGFGTRYTRNNSVIGGNPYYRNIGNAGVNTSEDFQTSWVTSVQEFTGTVSTNVSYAPFLLDETKRPKWVREVGWQTLDDIEERFTPVFEKIVLDELDDQIDKI
jgi:hypothetical protein